MLEIFSKIGRIKSVILISIGALVLAVIFTLICVFVISQFGIAANPIAGIIISSVVSLMLTPILSWYMIGQTLKIYELESDMRELATIDSLTGLLYRREFLERSEYLFKLSKRNELKFSIILADVDKLKQLNDNNGHMAGDKVLQSFSDVIQNTIRESDLACRYGGDEFILFLPNTSAEESLNVAERLISTIVQDNGLWNTEYHYSVSLGVASYPNQKMDHLNDIIDAADKALYQAKSANGNTIKIYGKEFGEKQQL